MTIKNCRECDKEVSDMAKTCPHCGIDTPVKSASYLPLFAVAIIPILILAMCSSKHSPDSPPSPTSQSSTDINPPNHTPEPPKGHQPVDINFPLFTQSIADDSNGAMVCPFSALFDNRVGHGFEALINAKESIFSHQEKIAAVGCEELRGGIPVYFEDNDLKRITELQSSNKVGFIPVQFISARGLDVGKVIFSGDLTNNPSGKYGENYTPIRKEVPQSAATDTHQASPAEPLVTESQIPLVTTAKLEPVAIPKQPTDKIVEQVDSSHSSKIWEPSFGCYSTLTETEKAICSDTKLSLLDKMMAYQYKLNLKQSNNLEQYKKTQSNWREYERNSCKDSIPCLSDVYRMKLDNFSISDVIGFMKSNDWALNLETWKIPDSCTQRFVHGNAELTVVYKCSKSSFSDLIISN